METELEEAEAEADGLTDLRAPTKSLVVLLFVVLVLCSVGVVGVAYR